MLNSLTTKKPKIISKNKPKIEVLESTIIENEEEERKLENLEKGFLNLKLNGGYGFDNRFTDVFNQLEDEVYELFEVDPNFNESLKFINSSGKVSYS